MNSKQFKPLRLRALGALVSALLVSAAILTSAVSRAEAVAPTTGLIVHGGSQL